MWSFANKFAFVGSIQKASFSFSDYISKAVWPSSKQSNFVSFHIKIFFPYGSHSDSVTDIFPSHWSKAVVFENWEPFYVLFSWCSSFTCKNYYRDDQSIEQLLVYAVWNIFLFSQIFFFSLPNVVCSKCSSLLYIIKCSWNNCGKMKFSASPSVMMSLYFHLSLHCIWLNLFSHTHFL